MLAITRLHLHTLALVSLLLVLSLAACRRPLTGSTLPPAGEALAERPSPTATLPPTASATPTAPPATATPLPPTATVPASPTPFYQGVRSTACGQALPLLPPAQPTAVNQLAVDPQALADLQAIVPENARPALSRILAAPESVGVAIYRVGRESEGIYLNADVAMPLASVVKLLHLVAYAEAVAAGELNPLTQVTLAEIEAFYLPNSDLSSHRRAINAMEADGRIFGEPPTMVLDAVPEMMMTYSSNAATDYLHALLGQERIEATAVALGLTDQTAPCPFLGQFLVMGNHTRTAENDIAAVEAYAEDAVSYGRDVALLADAYSNDAAFREAEIDWRSETRRPSVETQRRFSHTLSAHGTARQYAALMARLAVNGLSNADSSFTARRYLEWPMRFADNQALFTNLGYKNGSLPGILTTVYYAYPRGDGVPIVLALFYRDLPGRTYRLWRNDLPHDEFARWLLRDPNAIPALRAVLSPAGS